MNDYPNLDYSKLIGLLKKKAIETAQQPDEPRRQRTSPTRTPVRNEFEILKSEIEDLKGQIAEVSEQGEFGKIRTIREKIENLENIANECVNSEEIQDMVARQENPDKVMNRLNEMIAKKRQYETMEKGVPLEKQLEQAIREERYEDAKKIQDQLNRFKKLVSSRRWVVDTITITADNLDLTEINKPYDEGKTRKRHQFRFRNEPGGQDELFWDGMGGTLNKDKGIGTDQYQDVGVPSTVNLAEKKPMLKKPNPFEDRRETGMPNEKMERDPQEEKQTTDTWREFLDMQER